MKTLYQIIPASYGVSTILANMDFETYSEAGYRIDPLTFKVSSAVKGKPGIKGVGVAVYAEHPSTEVLSLAYDLKDGLGRQLWVPGNPPPEQLFQFFAEGNIASAWNSIFEYLIWGNVCVKKMGWPAIEPWQLFDTAVKARAFGLPSSLENAGKVLNIQNKKLDIGKTLIRRFSVPRTPTKKDSRTRILPSEDPLGKTFYEYNLRDIEAESEINGALPDLEPFEYDVWKTHTSTNLMGLHVDSEGIANCIHIVEQVTARYTYELYQITDGVVKSHDELKNMGNWLQNHGVYTPDLEAETVGKLIETLPDIPARRVLEIRKKLASAAVKKLYAMDIRKSEKDNRIRDLFMMYGASRTGRWSALGVQPHNFASAGPKVIFCENGCGRYYGAHAEKCPWCRAASFLNPQPVKWCTEAVDYALEIIAYKDLDLLEAFFGDALTTITGCLRGLITADRGNDIICSDYKSIEAVSMAEMARETWRQEVFRTHGRIYEIVASQISGIPFEEIIKYKEIHGVHHPLRKMGKVCDLAGIYGAWVGGWKKAGAGEFFNSDAELEEAILKWRDPNPMYKKYWSAMEDCFTASILNPAGRYSYNGLHFGMLENKLFIQLPSGRKLVYHEPKAIPFVDQYGRDKYDLSYKQWIKNEWVRVGTWKGKITENTNQAICRDILAYAMVQMDKRGYHIVLHVHDQPGAEVPRGFGSVKEFESFGGILPEWCAHWPIKLVDGWRGKRFRKD